MLQILIRTTLLIEVLFYVWLGGHLTDLGFSGGAIAASIILIAALWRVSHTLITHCIAMVFRWRDKRTLPFGNSLAALASELGARVVSYNWSQAFPGLSLGVDPIGAGSGAPILLVHGYFSNRGIWIRLRQRLAAANVGPIYTITLEPMNGSIEAMMPVLEARVNAIFEETGQEKIILVAHSLGGLVARAYVAQEGSARIAKLITLGSPHHGSRIAALGMFESAKQMRYRSPWIEMLQDREAAHPPGIPALSIYTLNEDLVYPPESSVLDWEGAENVPVSAVGHIALLYSEVIANRVIAAIRKSGTPA